MTTRHSRVLLAKVELLLPRLAATSRELWDSPRLRDLYPEYLCMLHTAIRSTVPLMECALEEAEKRTGDPAADVLATYLTRHIREEQGHDEWLRQDLDALGFDPREPLRRVPEAAVANLVGAQYYWIRHYHPACLLGHIAVLEGNPPAPGLVDELMRRTGYPRTGFRTLERHAALDVKHREELLRTIDGMPLTHDLATAVGLSALHSVDAADAALRAVLASRRAPVPAATRA
ncbi:iron-containing redox enzyme family protein [Streptomyces sp. NPDC050703]|uniref:iron-containing redox enzyme family protein n=1 Tax=Streptomyces sp. NPDC050703 TaxID=3157218 RepID=UPI003439A166